MQYNILYCVSVLFTVLYNIIYIIYILDVKFYGYGTHTGINTCTYGQAGRRRPGCIDQRTPATATVLPYCNLVHQHFSTNRPLNPQSGVIWLKHRAAA
jgi:hypothetical protein